MHVCCGQASVLLTTTIVESAGSPVPEHVSERASGADEDTPRLQTSDLACSEDIPSRSLSQQPPPPADAAGDPDQAPNSPAHPAAAAAPPAAGEEDEEVLETQEQAAGGGLAGVLGPDEATNHTAVSVWRGRKKPLCEFLLSQYANQRPARCAVLL